MAKKKPAKKPAKKPTKKPTQKPSAASKVKAGLYLLAIDGGIEISAHGPYATADEQFEQAKKINAAQNRERDSLFMLDINAAGLLQVYCFSGDAFLEDEPTPAPALPAVAGNDTSEGAAAE